MLYGSLLGCFRYGEDTSEDLQLRVSRLYKKWIIEIKNTLGDKGKDKEAACIVGGQLFAKGFAVSLQVYTRGLQPEVSFEISGLVELVGAS